MKIILPLDIEQQIAIGMREAESGKLSDGELFFDELERELLELQKKNRPPRTRRSTKKSKS